MVAASLPVVMGDTIDGEASVSNTSCEFIDKTVDTNTVDPESYFWIKTQVRDSDTLSDIENVVVKIFDNQTAVGAQDTKRSHYTFWFDANDNSWNSNLNNTLGNPFIDAAASEYPNDATVTEDNYNFKILLNGTANPNQDWNVYVEVNDEASSENNGTHTNALAVNTYVNYDVKADLIEWTNLQPDTNDNPSDSNPVIIENIETNVNYDVQTKLSGDWLNTNGDTITVTETSFDSTDSSGYHGQVSSSIFKDVYTYESYGEDLTEGINYFLDIPDGTSSGTFTNTFEIEVVAH
ncbi:hypothetical protein AKJ39_02685 [candidate division MSBL1 archaeon SCGC-AAA259J03]|nr:hypothetical protein AKJ39_02685 [candidate division MSBL1 archaeon SCGC-AAA259J03]